MLQKHLKEKQIKATITHYIYRAWHCYRYIQVHPEGIIDSVHYEYINGHWELHFENSADEHEVDRLRRKVMSQINSDGHIDWHRSEGNQRGYLNIEEIVEEDTFLSLFDELWDATAEILLYDYDKKEALKPESNNSNINIGNSDSFGLLSGLIGGDEYREPQTRISSVGDLPFESFNIPPYQRPYKWGTKNVNLLINDIITFCEKGTSEYRLGTLVLHQQSTDNTPLNIVDGQQRIITLVLLLNELSKQYKDLVLGIQIDSFLEKRQFHESTSQMHIRENVHAIRSRLNEFSKEHVRFLLKSCKFVLVTLHDISEAFQFFDSQNARGKELEPHDLLKAFHLREIPKITDTDKANISDWESLDTPRLANLFLVLFRIKRWIDGYKGREFTVNGIDTFKGPRNNNKVLPYQKIYAMAECYTELYNSDIARRIDRQHMDFPHQIDQITINGTLFFDMIRYYSQREIVIKELLRKHCEDIANAIDSYKERNRKGDQYTRSLFYAAIMFYYDKFCEEGFKIFVPKIFAWAYSMRIKQEAVQIATMDNYAREDNSFFRIMHRAITPSDIQNWVIEPIKDRQIKQKGKMPEIFKIFNNYNYIEQ